MLVLYIIAGVLGYGLVAGVAYHIVYAHTSADEWGSCFISAFWPFTLPGILGALGANAIAKRCKDARAAKELERAQVEKMLKQEGIEI